MEESYLAHVSEDGRKQTVSEHLRGVSELCGEFAGAFGAGRQGAWIGLAHDIGKCSAAFQKRLQGGARVDHSSAGAFECLKADGRAVWAAECVAGHHAGLPDFGNPRNPDSPSLCGRMNRKYLDALPKYESPVALTPPPPPPSGYAQDKLTDSFLIRMLYSCLVDADFLDTESFMKGGRVKRGAGEPLPVLWERLKRRKIAPWLEEAEHPDSSLSRREREILQTRCEILRNCMDAGTRPRGLYTLTVPTGGGKTVSSMAFALRHAIENGMSRVIYVIPFTSIIEQNAKVFRDIFGEGNVLEHHSAAAHEDAKGDCDIEDGKTALALAAENWDVPVVVTTSVQFFESLYGNRSSKCRKLHNIANSVIIFDEAQMLPVAHLKPCVAAIAQLAQNFNCTAVLCTATQPALGRLLQEYGLAAEELCPGTEKLYEQFRRVAFRNAGTLDADSLAAELQALPQTLCVVNTRKSAQEIYAKLPKDGAFCLSTLMYPAHRRAALDEIRKRLSDGRPCRVVSTSLIEAGVDVDFPSVWREAAGLDSILQAAGRCNREGKRDPSESVVTIFQGVSHTPELLKANIGAAEEVLQSGADPGDPETVARYFQILYHDFMGDDRLDESPVPGKGCMSVVKAFREGFDGNDLPFATVAEHFHMINSPTKTVYIPKGDGEKLVEALKFGEPSRELYRKLGQYAVNVYEGQYKELLLSGSVEPLDADGGALRDLSRYGDETGLSVPAGELGFLNF